MSSPSPSVTRPGRLAAVLLVGALAAACADQAVEPTAPVAGPLFSGGMEPATPSVTTVCKIGPPGDYPFTISRSESSVVTEGWEGTLLVVNPFAVAAGACLDVFQADTSLADYLVVRELVDRLPPGVALDFIEVQRKGGDCASNAKYCPVRVDGQDFAAVTVSPASAYTITFHNKADTPPPGTCGKCEGKVTQLTLRNNGPAGQVTVTQKDGEVIFSGFVASGDTFSFIGTDKKGTMGTEIRISVDGQAHTTIHTSCSQPIGPGLVRGDFEVVDGTSRRGGALCPIASAECDFCADEARAKALELIYTGEDCSASSHAQDAGKFSCSGSPALASPVRIVVSDKSDPDDPKAKKWFDGVVPRGGAFTVDADNAGRTKLAANSWAFVYSSTGVLLQTLGFHTSCSQPLNQDDQFGSLRLTGFTPEP